MAQDLKKLLQGNNHEEALLNDGHEKRFEARLDKAFSSAQNSKKSKNHHGLFWLRVAAIAIIFLSLGFFGYQRLNKDNSDSLVETSNKVEAVESVDFNGITLGDISPDLKRVENFYLTGINVQLASLDMTDENKELIDAFLVRLDELNAEYTALNKELNEVGPTEATINALIDNLKLRLELLLKLKNKLKELKNENNEQLNSFEA